MAWRDVAWHSIEVLGSLVIAVQVREREREGEGERHDSKMGYIMWYGVLRYGLVWLGMAWHGVVWRPAVSGHSIAGEKETIIERERDITARWCDIS